MVFLDLDLDCVVRDGHFPGTRADGRDFLTLAGKLTIRTHIRELPLTQANEALAMVRRGDVQGASVLRP
jgi:propanol-preferring alcohol dehydrogenase